MNRQQQVKKYNPWLIASIILGALVLAYICFSYYQDKLYKDNYVVSKVLVNNAIAQVPNTKRLAIVCPMQAPEVCFNVLPAEAVLKYQIQSSSSK